MSNNTNWRWILFYLLISYLRLSSQVSTPASKSYIAAVVEFASESVTNSAESTLHKNTLEYEELIQSANKQKVDIIVFPEDGLTTTSLERSLMDSWTTLIPSANTNYTPCTTDMNGVSETLKRISCAAKKNQIYVVINIAEKEPCTGNNCPKEKAYYYNTNVVFDRNGTIIARYRKINLFVEPEFNSPLHPEVVTFDTDFGVKFGTFICFDILFAKPALTLTRNLKVNDIVFPTAWFSETPFLTAVQTQLGWAFAENVNLLAAGYNDLSRGNTGSGIYLGRNGLAIAHMATNRTTKLLVAEVPKMPKRNVTVKIEENIQAKSKDNEHVHAHDELRRKREVIEEPLKLLRDNISLYHSELLEGNVTKTLCHNNHCCNFTIEMGKLDKKVQYRSIVFNGIRNIADIRWVGVRLCAVVQCSNDTVESCGSIVNSETTFNAISISGKFDESKNSLIMPNTLNNLLMPLSNWIYEEYSHNDHKHVFIHSNKSITNPVTFGVYCRDYDKDLKSTAVSSSIAYLFSILMAFLLVRSF